MSERKFATCREGFKEEAVRLYLAGMDSYRQLCEQLGNKNAKGLRSLVAKVERGKSRGGSHPDSPVRPEGSASAHGPAY